MQVCYKKIKEQTDCNVVDLEHWSNILLEKLLQLYVRVRMHSFAKDVKEKYKVKNDERKVRRNL